MLPIFYIGSLPIPVYGTIIILAYIIGVFFASRHAYIYGYTKGNIFTCSALAAIGTIVGAKLFYFITTIPILVKSFDIVVTSPLNSIYYAFSGYVFYGGLAGAVFMIFLYCVQMDFNFLRFMNVVTPAIPFIHSLGRIGCFMGGCCYGIEYDGSFCVQFPYNEFIPVLSRVPRFPVQLLESAALFILFIIFYVDSKHIFNDGVLVGAYLIAYGAIRFFTEFLRGDVERGFLLSLSTSQWISIIAVILGIFWISGKKQANY